jgi:hypothetical protein
MTDESEFMRAGISPQRPGFETARRNGGDYGRR